MDGTCIPTRKCEGVHNRPPRALSPVAHGPGQKAGESEVDGEAVHRTAAGGRKDDDHWRDLQLQSLGWKVRRFWVYELRDDLPKCLARVHADITG
jgi:hypothetical protein